MYYSGRLKTNNKQFDACQSGKPFKFRLGKGEVIKVIKFFALLLFFAFNVKYMKLVMAYWIINNYCCLWY